jgi:Fic family protein
VPQLETTYRIEPCLLESYPAKIADLAGEAIALGTSLGGRLHPKTAASLADLVRVMNCYYSNLIEGHNTRPRDIERALADQLEANDERRDLQLEARAHIRVQRNLDARLALDASLEPASVDFIAALHREFYEDAPKSMLRIKRKEGSFTMVPGAFRSLPKHDVMVGRHQPPSSARVHDFMTYFEQKYRFEPLGPVARIVAMAAAHHRFNYIHPFPDGNGRVSRLMSHAMAARAGIGAHGLWSISRGLARGLEAASEYKQMMDHADVPRRSSLDGRGNLSQEALIDFIDWFCRVAIDQLRFMNQIFALDTLSERLSAYVRAALRANEAAATLAKAVLHRGEIARGEAGAITGRPERSARDALSKLVDARLLISDTAKGPVRLSFTSESADVLFPRLFPAQV